MQDRICLLEATLAENPEKVGSLLVIVLFRASRHGVTAMIWIVYGLAASSMIPLMGNIGFVVALYYLLRMAAAVGPIPHNTLYEVQTELDESKVEMAALKSQLEEHSKGVQPPAARTR